MRLAIIGSRSFTNIDLAEQVFVSFFPKGKVSLIVSGGAKGADLIGREISKRHSIELLEFIPDWENLGKSAGFIRNRQIVESSDMVLAFHDGISRGTQNSLDVSRQLKKPSLIWFF
jgi:hypothetical protein